MSKKISELTPVTSVDPDALFLVVINPDTAPESRSATFAVIEDSLNITPPPAGADISARVYQDAANSVDSSWQVLAFATEVYDTADFFDISEPTRFTIPTTGKYSYKGQMRVDANAVTGIRVRVNGDDNLVIDTNTRGNGGSPEYVQVSGEYEFTAGDYIEFMGMSGSFQYSSGDKDTHASIRQEA